MNTIIPIDIYNIDILFVGGTAEDLKASLGIHLGKEEAKEAYNEMADDIDDCSLGRSALLSSGQVVLWVSDSEDKATLAHEIFHSVCFIMEKVGISLCHESDEAYAYLIGYVTKKVNEYLNPSCESLSQ